MPLPAAHRREVRANVKKAMAPKFVIAGRAKARRGALSAQREEVPLGCNLAGPGWITGHSRRKHNCLPEIATAPLGPRNDNSGAFAILTAAYTGRKCVAGRGQPGPYIA